MKRLKRQLLEKEEVLIKMHEYFNGEKIYQQIEKELEKNK